MACPGYMPSANPRTRGCERCGLLPKHHVKTAEVGKRPRDLGLERKLTEIAAKSAGLHSTAGLDDFADRRAHPGGVREALDAVQEAAEELADARNYLTWGIERVYDAMLAGDSEATATYERLMRSLAGVVVAWDALVRG